MKTLLIDGDILLFTICRISEDITDFGDGEMKSFDKDLTIRLLNEGLDAICEKCGYERDDTVFCITDKVNFRKRFFPTYKSNRKNVVKPLGLPFIREYLLENKEKYQTFMVKELEADDVMGIYGSMGNETISIYSQDKDLFTIPCRQWDFKKDKFITPSVFESDKFLYTQVLTGDSVDGYKGCPQIGKIKAAKALVLCKTELQLLEACHKLYFTKYKGFAKEKLLEQIGQARILHERDYQNLIQNDRTYNPYSVYEVSDEMQEMWEQE